MRLSVWFTDLPCRVTPRDDRGTQFLENLNGS
jgi:hypothetical protein